MVSLATLLQKLTVFVTSFADLINSIISSSLTCILFSCNILVMTLSKSTFFSSVIVLLKMCILLLDDNKLLSQYSLSTTSFPFMGGLIFCNFIGIFHVNIFVII